MGLWKCGLKIESMPLIKEPTRNKIKVLLGLLIFDLSSASHWYFCPEVLAGKWILSCMLSLVYTRTYNKMYSFPVVELGMIFMCLHNNITDMILAKTRWFKWVNLISGCSFIKVNIDFGRINIVSEISLKLKLP